ncbi:hypothetical protein M2277_005634 [Paenibacillus sp. LBL]|uniref:hypothetical protein n=1 Tax=Paenibacillus sp. LBL TaxID=2940563 RepID=UPI0024763061|nr:hypothetical protein [Paenibacillus sp. LBL]MDH6674935.1 hypothetical protein [Paenibacillus sp. LBL]
MSYVFIGISTVAYILLVLILAIPIASLLSTVKARYTGRYLNRYYVVSHKGSGIYELHCSPVFGFYYAMPEKYFALHEDAIRKFKAGYPNTSLYAVTSTLQGYYARKGIKGTPVEENHYKKLLGDSLSYFLILRNMANYRKRNEKEWQFAHLIQRVRQNAPRRYLL